MKLAVGLFALLATTNMFGPDPVPGSIAGKVKGTKGFDQAGAAVMVWPCNERFFYCEPPHTLAPGSSGGDGSFVIRDLPPGWYIVVVAKSGYTPWSTDPFLLWPGREAFLEIELSPIETRPPIHYKSASPGLLRASYEDALEALEEPLFCTTTLPENAVESYRFLWMRTFHRPVLIHLIISVAGTGTVRYKETNGEAGYDYGTLVVNQKIDVAKVLRKEGLPDDMVEGVISYLREKADEHFWTLDYEIDDRRSRCDGAEWTVEGMRGEECHVVTRPSPRPEDPFRQFADSLIRFSGKRYYYDEMY